jgi:hypothetical protein
MIRITKGQANTVIVTTTEKGSAAHYLFAFKNMTSNQTKYCIADDTSSFRDRYNAFTITETATPTPTNAQVTLTLEGEYKYTIYGQASASNLNPAGLTAFESGMCIVTGTTTATPTYTGNDAQTFAVYNG